MLQAGGQSSGRVVEKIAMNDAPQVEALEALTRSWPRIVEECRSVLGSELHYQAVIYHCLRSFGKVPPGQLAMNVKIWIPDVVSEYFRMLDLRKAEDFRGGFEPIPDLVIFRPEIAGDFGPEIVGDFRRRNHTNSLRHMLLAAEIKASERFQGRLQAGEIRKDILKLDALRLEARAREADVIPAVIIVDTAPDEIERMGSWALEETRDAATSQGVCFFYLSPEDEFFNVPEEIRP
jgi:hypothetical protein